MNKFIGIGRTTKDIEIKKMQNGKEYTIFNLAITRPYSTQKETDFIPCQVWNKQAITLQKYCKKGSQIAISGILQSYKNKDNKIEWIVQVSNYEFLHTNNNVLSKKPQENNSNKNNDYIVFNGDDAILWD
ncbi:single-stranded DNA-binding protein [Spiroplasma mirum]|uniref:single-stranded DNA-binding protein n=1 Tax=Spiroplasma mirum TaxID=2144 RepID=UPI0003DFBCD4|nr:MULTISPECIES: single-stranded DNA-binding protein [Spiroplasma]AHF61019.1 putative single-strand binding protein SSB [Spiroplasma mirum ATCC 29335]AKM53126.1 single-stranded DNA-binding protein [Spiroplasma atrichopogonis]